MGVLAMKVVCLQCMKLVNWKRPTGTKVGGCRCPKCNGRLRKYRKAVHYEIGLKAEIIRRHVDKYNELLKTLCPTCKNYKKGMCAHYLIPITLEGLDCPSYIKSHAATSGVLLPHGVAAVPGQS